MIKVGVIGYGYWGPSLARNIGDARDCRLVAICDPNQERLAAAKERFPRVATWTTAGDLLASPDVDAVVIATPIATHFDLALAALRGGRHVLVEKPIAQTRRQAEQLIEAADQRSLTLMVDHTFVYSGAVGKIQQIVSSPEFGEPLYYDSMRVNLGLFQHDANVVWDLAVHDLCILDYLFPHPPRAVSATGMCHVPGGMENIAYLTLFYDSTFIAHVAVNWLAPVKVRQVLIGGSNQMIVYNDLEPSEKVKVYDKGITVSSDLTPEKVHRLLVGYRTGDMWAPDLGRTEALQTVATHFLDCIRAGRRPITDGQAGLRTVKILEAAARSMRDSGCPVEVEWRESS